MQASPATEQRCFRWSVAGKPLVVDLPLPVVENLAAEVRVGLETTGRGVEIGGLLLGRVRRESGRTLVIVDDIEPVDCEHVAGPSYMLSTADRRSLEARLRRRRGAVVGFYRSNTRKDFVVTVEDVALMGWYFSHPSDTFLLIDASRTEQLRAAFVLWDGRAMAQKTADDEFPLDATALAGRSHTGSPRALPPAPVKVGNRGWFAAAAVALALSAGLVVDRTEHSAPPPHGAATRIPSAEPPRPVEPLAAAAPVEFTAPPSIAPPAVATPPLATPPLATPPLATPPLATPQLASGNAVSPTVSPTVLQAADRRVLEVPAPNPPAEAPSPDVADAPAIDVPAGPSLPLAALGVAAAPPPPPPSARPPVTANPAVSVSVNAVTRGLGPKFIPPAALREVRPEVPPNLQGRLSRDVQMVRVRVYVDRAGNVQFAELLSDGIGQNRELASLAVFAARRWQFAPASRDGKPVDAQAVLRFRFGPSGE